MRISELMKKLEFTKDGLGDVNIVSIVCDLESDLEDFTITWVKEENYCNYSEEDNKYE